MVQLAQDLDFNGLEYEFPGREAAVGAAEIAPQIA